MGEVVEQKWLFDVCQKTSKNPFEGRAKTYLNNALYRSITSHNLQECYNLLHVLPRDTTLDPYIVFRFIFILIESNKNFKITKNVMIYLETLLNRLDLSKPDVFIEFIAYFMRHNRIDDAKELFDQKHRYMTYQVHREVPFVDINLSCYQFLLNFLTWQKQIERPDNKFRFDVSIQGWLVNAMDQLKNISSNYEYFVMCITKVLVYYGFTKKAYLFVSQFQRNNKNNISAQLLLLKLLHKFMAECPDSKKMDLDISTETDELEQNRTMDMASLNNFSHDLNGEAFDVSMYPIHEDKESILINLRRLDPSREEIFELSASSGDLVAAFIDHMNALECLSELNNFGRWQTLESVLRDILSSKNDTLIKEIKSVWNSRYRRYWSAIDFLSLIGKVEQDEQQLVERVLKLLRKKFN